jgi:hypothetical protein
MAVGFILGTLFLGPAPAKAHCDGMDGPVVKAAQRALATGNVNLVLIWVQKADEEQIRQAFDRTLAVRKLSAEAAELADTYFFETLVRIHRAGEGAPYTGLKPTGRDLGPAIPLADQVVSTATVDPLVDLLTQETRNGLTERFNHLISLRDYSTADVEAGREYVQAYVAFIHYAERAYEAAHQPAIGHISEHGRTVH